MLDLFFYQSRQKISIREPSGPLERKRRTDNSQFYFIQLGITEDEIFSRLAIIMRDQETVTAAMKNKPYRKCFLLSVFRQFRQAVFLLEYMRRSAEKT